MEQPVSLLRPRKIRRTASGHLLRTISDMFFFWVLFALLCPWSALGLRGAELGSHCPACLSSSSGSATREGNAAPGRSWAMLGGCRAAFTLSLGAGERQQVRQRKIHHQLPSSEKSLGCWCHSRSLCFNKIVPTDCSSQRKGEHNI